MFTTDTLQDKANRRVYHAAGVTRSYGSQSFDPAEVMIFMRHRDAFVGRDILDVGVGTGRTTRCLAPLARRYVAIDYSPVMISHMRANFPAVAVVEADIADLSAFADASFDTVFATNNVVDVLSHARRLQALAEICRVLKSGGSFIFTTHNLEYGRQINGPNIEWSLSPVKMVKAALLWLRRQRNHLRIKHLRRIEPEYALLNDIGHDFACLHYYIDPEIQARQLAEAGFSLIELVNQQGQVFMIGAVDISNASWLMYVARKR